MTTKDVVKQDALPSSFDELSAMAKAFVQSGMFQDIKQLSQAIVKIQAGRELGLPPVYSMQNINMIRNRLTSSANTLAMLVKRSGRYNYRIKEHTEKVCTITFYEKDGDKWAEVGESSFSMDDAKRAELVKPDSGWAKFPRAMLFSRSISQGARIYAPDAIGGMYTDEEIRSIPPRLNEEEPVPEAPATTPEASKAQTGDKIPAKTEPTPPAATDTKESPAKITPEQVNKDISRAMKENLWDLPRIKAKITELGGNGGTVFLAIRSLKPDKLAELNNAVQEILKPVIEEPYIPY